MNLTANAGDAMPAGGTLTIATANPPAPDGGVRSVHLTVTDTGIGMSPEVQARVFEPFFTTKAHGRGTGLGLATVHGIVTQAGGEVLLRSAPGQGTCVEVRLPTVEAPRVVKGEIRARRNRRSHAASSWSPRTRRTCGHWWPTYCRKGATR